MKRKNDERNGETMNEGEKMMNEEEERGAKRRFDERRGKLIERRSKLAKGKGGMMNEEEIDE